jgi:hypothetical protein
VARRSDVCLTEPEHQPVRKEGQRTSLGAHVPDQDTRCIAPEGVISELSVLVRPLEFGLQALGGAASRYSRLAWSLAGSAERLLKTVVAFGDDMESAERSDDRPRCSVHCISPYESDVWD